MAQVIIAIGSNLGNPHSQLLEAALFLDQISDSPAIKSPIYESEPVGSSESKFLNAIIGIESELSPKDLLLRLKEQERRQGRPSRYPKWTARTLDLDIIGYGKEILKEDKLIIPHPEYTRRLFVLLPLADVLPNWKDPETNASISALIQSAPKLTISKTTLHW
jgi:2-amino-4-hydroxy-6-hydroxymethyldihydropteridine diphosphokinase